MAEQDEKRSAIGTIWNYTGSLTVSCGCGSPIPVVIPFSQGMKLVTRCRKCQASFALHVLHFDLDNPNNDGFAIEHKPHMMIEAASQMPSAPVEQVLNNVTPFGPLKGRG